MFMAAMPVMCRRRVVGTVMGIIIACLHAPVILPQRERGAGTGGTRSTATRFAVYAFGTGLRRGCAVKGADVADIQDLYGHTNPSTTMVYAPPELVRHQFATARLRLLETGVAPKRLAETAGSTGRRSA